MRYVYKASLITIFWLTTMVGVFLQSGETAQYKVFVVMSYDESYPWVQEIKEGIEAVLADTAHTQLPNTDYPKYKGKTAFKCGYDESVGNETEASHSSGIELITTQK